MAEQAINTIYLLGEQPDVACDQIIKHLAARVFEGSPKSAPDMVLDDPEPPEADESTMMDIDDAATVTGASPKSKPKPVPTSGDMGDAFLLSQLVFVVGHVAIKHIVYLELVERELKRRRDVAAKGTLFQLSGVLF